MSGSIIIDEIKNFVGDHVVKGGITDNEPVYVQLLFDVSTSDRIQIDAEITDQYVEDNTAVQDHMALKPLEFTFRGFVGEKVFTPKLNITDQIYSAFDKLAIPQALVPQLTNYMNDVIGLTSYIEDSFNRYYKTFKSIKNFFKRDNTETLERRQAQICQELRRLRDNRVFVSVKNDYGEFNNCLILNAYMEKNESELKSEMVVTIKQLRNASTTTTQLDLSKYRGRTLLQRSKIVDKGKVQGIKKILGK